METLVRYNFKIIIEFFHRQIKGWRVIIRKLTKAWPVIILFKVIYFHVLLLSLSPELWHECINIWISSIYQIIGACSILYQINKNLKTFKNIDLFQSFLTYLKELPIRDAQGATLFAKAADFKLNGSVISGDYIGTKAPKTLEEKIDLLANKIDELNKKVDENNQRLNKKLQANHEKLSNRITAIIAKTNKLSGRLIETVVGDYKSAIFGVLMISYGIIVPIIDYYIR